MPREMVAAYAYIFGGPTVTEVKGTQYRLGIPGELFDLTYEPIVGHAGFP